MILTEGTTEMKMVVRYRTNNACVLHMNQVNVVVIVLVGVIINMTTDLFNSADIAKVRALLLSEQGNKCAITKLPLKAVDTHCDHAHDNDQLVRGAVNKHANMLLGKLENLQSRYLKHWYPYSLSIFLRQCADYLDRPPDKRWRHPNWVAKSIVLFNKLKVSQQQQVLEVLGQPKGNNIAERRKLLKKAILTRKYSRDFIYELLNKGTNETFN